MLSEWRRLQWRRLALFAAFGLTVLAVLFPPFIVNGGPYEYGFVLTAPPSAARAYAAMSDLGGRESARIVAGLIHYAVDISRLLFELAVVWCVFAALRSTVLRPDPAPDPALPGSAFNSIETGKMP